MLTPVWRYLSQQAYIKEWRKCSLWDSLSIRFWKKGWIITKVSTIFVYCILSMMNQFHLIFTLFAILNSSQFSTNNNQTYSSRRYWGANYPHSNQPGGSVNQKNGGITWENYCFTVPQLNTRYFTDDSNLVSYISATMAYEMLNVHYFSSSWLQSQDVGPLPEITNSEWLSAHVNTSFPAISRLTIS